jgi:DnaJ-class molecular chaperone
VKDNPYELLGLKPDATEKDIKAAYRKLAKKLHPDLNPGDPKAEEKFKAISKAHALLSDKKQRARYDRGEIDAAGNEMPQQQYYRSYADAGPEHHYYNTGGFEDLGHENDFFSELFGRAGARGSGRNSTTPFRGSDVQYQLKIEFMDAALGAKRRITLPNGSSLDVSVPAGMSDGQNMRLKGKGNPGINGGPNGDAYVQINVAPHKNFKRDKRNILLELPVTLDEAILGSKISVPTIHGNVTMTIPKGASSGQTMRLKGKGIAGSKKAAAGDQLVRLKIIMPAKIDPELEAFMETWKQKNSYEVRQDLQGATR